MEEDTDLPGLAMALTGDRVRAAALVARAKPATLNGLIQTYLHNRPVPAEGASDRAPLDPELDEIAQRLDQLTPSSRAALTLALGRRMTYAEIATFLERTPTKITGLITQATAALEADDYTITATLEQLAWQSPDDTLLARTRHSAARERQRYRHRLTVVIVGLALVVVASVAIPAIRAHQPLYHRPIGEWSYGLDITPPDGWRIQGHLVGADFEYLAVGRGGTTGIDGSIDTCEIWAGESTSEFLRERGTPAESRKIRIGTKNAIAGRITEPGTPGIQVDWTYSSGAEVSVTCTARETVDAETRAIDTARRLRFARIVLRVPVSFPRGFDQSPIYVGEFDGQLLMNFSSLNESRRELTAIHTAEATEVPGRAIQSAGREASLAVGEGGARVCIPRSTPHVCVNETSDGSGGDSPDQATDKAEKRVLAFAAQLHLARSMTDRGTWFDANTALPH